MTDPIIKSAQWSRAYGEDGGLKDMFDGMREAYFRRAGKLDPTLPADVRNNALDRLSFAANIVDMVEAHVRAIIDDGKIEQHNQIYAERIANVPERKRGFLKF
jgi:hypothetical protein